MASWDADVAIIGAGAAGLMAGIWAGRAGPGLRVVALDGAARLGAKILVAGGGRCNVTHERVAPADFAGSPPHAIRRVLGRFDVADTERFFAELGVKLKREPTGKLFPVTDRARSVLDALLRAATTAGVILRYPRRVAAIAAADGGFIVSGDWGRLAARQAILATGGCSLPKSGSDGAGYRLAEALGHSVTRVFPALVPLTLAPDFPLLALSGISAAARLTVEASAGGKPLAQATGGLLCTRFGLSGPAALDISRHWLAARRDDAGARLIVNWLPEATAAELSQALQSLGRGTIGAWLGARLPERLARTLLALAGVDPARTGAHLTRAERQATLQAVTRLPVPVVGDRGFAFAETTAGGVPLRELYLDRMASRRRPGLYLCGEICDVDGRIGGFNFQWAWASGYVAGTSAARALTQAIA